jgi:4-hydroxy-tetrahydrodipicolinate synthase
MPLPGDSDYAGELARLRPKLGQDFAIGYSGDWGCAEATLAGGDTWYSVVAGLLPVAALRLMRAAETGNAEETKRIDAAFQPLWALFREFGSIRVVYAAANILSLTVSEPPRPILPLTSAERQRVEEALEALSVLETAP